MSDLSTVERAFDIARSGSVRNMSELRKALRKEGFASAEQHTEGFSIQRQLKDAMAKAAQA